MFRIDGLEEGIFISRLNRFVCECQIKKRRVLVHLPNSGRLNNLLFFGKKIYAKEAKKENGLKYRLVFVEDDNDYILVDSHLANEIVSILIKNQMLPKFEGYKILKKETYFGGRRFDFLLEKKGKSLLLEVKNSSLFWNSLAMFPDCETKRGRVHLDELAKIKDEDMRGGILFIVSSPKVKYFLPDFHNDPDFATRLYFYKDFLDIHAYSVSFGKDFSLKETRELIIPWSEIEVQKKDSGIYLLLIEIKNNSSINVGGLRNVFFRGGYYVYVGSAAKNMKKRIERHRRLKKRAFWHVDYLTCTYPPFFYFPIRIEKKYECELSKSLLEICDWFVPKFGSRDCRCKTHLFGFKENPLNNEKFMRVVLHFRIGVIEEKIKKEAYEPQDKGRSYGFDEGDSREAKYKKV